MQQVAPLTRPIAAAIVTALLACAAAAWLFTITTADSMGAGGMAMMSAGLFLITWLVMMVAMMFPSVAPMTLTFAAVSRTRGEGLLPTAVFVFGYLVVWTAAGLIPLAILAAGNQIWMTPPPWLPHLGGAVIILAGLYQFTPLKDVCLRACRTPLGFILSHDFGAGPAAAVRAGASHGLYCIGCCWALMAILAVLGLMNITWMAVFAAIFFIERNVRFGDLLPRAVGVASIVGGLALLI